MADAIKDFFNKKKMEAKFKMAGPGHKLADNSQSTSHASASSSNTKASSSANKSGAADQAGQAALKRFGQQGHSKPTGTLENILQEEKKRILEEYKQKEENEAIEKEQSKQENRYKEFEAKQLFSCPQIGINEPCSLQQLVGLINEKIASNFSDDATLKSALLIKNCNSGIVNENEKLAVDQCISLLDKILTNLMSSCEAEELQKFKRLRKSKIKQKILNIQGAYEFLLSIGFEEDADDWLVYKGQDDQLLEQMSYYKDILNDAMQFPIVLDRQFVFYKPDGNYSQEELSEDFFQLTASELQREQELLTAKKDMEESLMTKAMREQFIARMKPISKFTRLRIKLQNGNILEATFFSKETLNDVKTFVLSQCSDLNDFSFIYGRDLLPDSSYSKTLDQLSLVPAAALSVR